MNNIKHLVFLKFDPYLDDAVKNDVGRYIVGNLFSNLRTTFIKLTNNV